MTEAAKNMATPTPLDVASIKADFPILSETVYGKPLIFLDSAASAQKPSIVINAPTDQYLCAFILYLQID